jgi:hypothetical protein
MIAAFGDPMQLGLQIGDFGGRDVLDERNRLHQVIAQNDRDTGFDLTRGHGKWCDPCVRLRD